MKHKEKYWHRVRKELGLCVRCGVRPALHGKKRCVVCMKRRKSEKR